MNRDRHKPALGRIRQRRVGEAREHSPDPPRERTIDRIRRLEEPGADPRRPVAVGAAAGTGLTNHQINQPPMRMSGFDIGTSPFSRRRVRAQRDADSLSPRRACGRGSFLPFATREPGGHRHSPGCPETVVDTVLSAVFATRRDGAQ